jgi:HlyD family secretion protein
MKRKLLLATAIVTVTGLSAAAMFARRGTDGPVVVTDVVSRGTILTTVTANGTLEAVDTVQVGTQVSGSILSLGADFNSIVKKGQVLARLDPSIIQAEIERAKANLLGAEAAVEGLTVQLTYADTKLNRAQALAARELISASDLEAALLTTRTTEAQIKSASAQVTQARAALSQSQVNLQKTVISSPIDGIVISRSVDVGQTVAASLQAPTLFTIAADLREMQLKASIDESDLGNIKDGQPVTFRVDAYPNDVFRGTVQQVRLNPVIESNVVTYAAIVSAPNAQLKLKPGMTATLTVEVTRRDDVLRVPSAALRFKPSQAVLAALGQPPVDPAPGQVADSSGREGNVKPTGTAGRHVPKADHGTVWIYEADHIEAVDVTTGATDGSFTEIVTGDVRDGTTLAMRVTMPGAAAATAAPRSPTSNPLLGQTPRRF